MVANAMAERGVSVRQVARQLDVTESGLRYRLGRAPDAPDGRRDRATALDGWAERVDAVLTRFDDGRVVAGGTGHCPAQTLYALLRREHGVNRHTTKLPTKRHPKFPIPVSLRARACSRACARRR